MTQEDGPQLFDALQVCQDHFHHSNQGIQPAQRSMQNGAQMEVTPIATVSSCLLTHLQLAVLMCLATAACMCGAECNDALGYPTESTITIVGSVYFYGPVFTEDTMAPQTKAVNNKMLTGVPLEQRCAASAGSQASSMSMASAPLFRQHQMQSIAQQVQVKPCMLTSWRAWPTLSDTMLPHKIMLHDMQSGLGKGAGGDAKNSTCRELLLLMKVTRGQL